MITVAYPYPINSTSFTLPERSYSTPKTLRLNLVVHMMLDGSLKSYRNGLASVNLTISCDSITATEKASLQTAFFALIQNQNKVQLTCDEGTYYGKFAVGTLVITDVTRAHDSCAYYSLTINFTGVRV